MGWGSRRRSCHYTPGETHRKGPNLSSPGLFPPTALSLFEGPTRCHTSKVFGQCPTLLTCEHWQESKCREINSSLANQTFIHSFMYSFIHFYPGTPSDPLAMYLRVLPACSGGPHPDELCSARSSPSPNPTLSTCTWNRAMASAWGLEAGRPGSSLSNTSFQPQVIPGKFLHFPDLQIPHSLKWQAFLWLYPWLYPKL